MRARHRSAIILSILAIALFIVRWPMDNSICDYDTWKWRPTPTEGVDFFSAVFRGGAGTPAVFAMLGGQRYMVANILWNYSEVLFHKGKLYEMVNPMESTVSLNPSFTEAWNTYGWHLAWNIYSYTDDPVEKQKWMEAGKQVYIRAVKTNPKKPAHRGELAWLYMQREANYRKALNILEPVVYPPKDGIQFKPLTPELAKKTSDPEVIDEHYWDLNLIGRRLGVTYIQLTLLTGDWAYQKKAIKLYEYLHKLDPNDKTGPKVLARLKKDLYNEEYLRAQQDVNAKIRKNWGLPRVDYGKSIEEIYPDPDGGITGIEGVH